MITFGNTSIDIKLIITFLSLGIVWLLFGIAGIWLVVQGFRVHWGWGFANLLFPFAAIVFCFLHFNEARKPVGLIMVALTLLLFFFVFTKVW